MNETMPEELFTTIKKAMEKSSLDSPPLSRTEEQRMELMMAGYKGDRHIRAWLIVAMDTYAKAVVKGKSDVFVDGFIHLRKILFGEKEGGE